MPLNRSRAEPPEVMTWGKALLLLIVAALFDLLRLFFQMFWFFGPALAAAYCDYVASDWVGSLWGLTAAACTGAAGAAGAAAFAFVAPVGVIMASAVGFIGFLVLGLWILMTNRKLFSTAASAPLSFAGAFAVGEIPFIGALPVFTIALWRLYKTQIHAEREELKKWKAEQAAAQLEVRKRQSAQLMQLHAAQEAANDEQYRQQADIENQEQQEDEKERMETEAANEDTYRVSANGQGNPR